MDNLSSVDSKNDDKVYSVKKIGKEYKLADQKPVELLGEIAFGIRTFDRLNGANNKNGVYSIKLFVDEKCIWSYRMDKLSFSQGRYINTLIDYAEYIDNHWRIQRSYVSPNNGLMVYGEKQNDGIFYFEDGKSYSIKYLVTDHFGNTSTLKFNAVGRSSNGNHNNGFHKQNENKIAFLFPNENTFTNDEVNIRIPPNALYDNISFKYSAEKRCKSCFSKLHRIHYRTTPLHKYMTLEIQPDTVIPEKYHKKAVLVRIGKKGRKISIGGEWKNGFLSAATRSFGDYAIMIDTVTPEIKAVNVYPGKNISKQNNIKIRIDDDLAGIKSYKATLNGRWILMEYNINTDLLVYNFDERLMRGKNSLELTVIDNCGNKAIYRALLVR
jgi:hypothetical protein